MGYIIIRSSIKDSDLIIKPTTFILLFVSSHQKSTSTHFHFPPYNKITQVPPFHHFNLFIKPIKRSVCSSQNSRRSVTKMASSSSILRQLSGKEGWNSTSSSKRWSSSNKFGGGGGSGNVGEKSLKQMQGFNGGGGYNNFCGGGMVMRKRVMVVVDQSSSSKHAMMWALTHVTNKGDLLTLLHIIPPQTHHNSDNSHERFSSSPSNLAHSLGSLCKASKPEVEVEALVVQGPKLATVMNQVKKLEVCVLVLGQKKPSLISCFCGSSSEAFVEHCINNAECLTLGVRRQSQGMGGYLISSRWQKNFWLLA